ncbi:MAG: undecaprenyl/decaprenyl-phosphate alpha-N-acetylglucosaminyl 1-phosphate transferase [Alphaproteobacteria bacterium]|nr:undecaprenyl/decaprenyl-phosphate alpha-N-acetylglucosaminyl 1-phosphate transferase [Alphaproteobacteria bacterium]
MPIEGRGPAIVMLLAAVAVTLLVCAYGRAIGEFLGVIAYPDRLRRLHNNATPQVGGMAVLLGLVTWLTSIYLFNGTDDPGLVRAILLCGLGVGAVGFADDQSEISPVARVLLLLVFLAVAFVVNPEFITTTLKWSSFEPATVPVWAYIVLVGAATVGVANAVNMADGQNGVVGSMFAIWSACLMVVTTGLSREIAAVLCVLSLVFLALNLRGKVFLGDCGSYGITFILGLLVVLAHARKELPLETVVVWFFIPVMDCLRLLIGRPLRGESPFSGDRDHFHHRLQDKIGHTKAILSYIGAVASTSVIATLEPRFALACLCVLSAYYFSFAWLTDANIPPASNEQVDPAKAATNVVALKSDRTPDIRRQGTVN